MVLVQGTRTRISAVVPMVSDLIFCPEDGDSTFFRRLLLALWKTSHMQVWHVSYEMFAVLSVSVTAIEA